MKRIRYLLQLIFSVILSMVLFTYISTDYDVLKIILIIIIIIICNFIATLIMDNRKKIIDNEKKKQ
jgi:hypothetical protein